MEIISVIPMPWYCSVRLSEKPISWRLRLGRKKMELEKLDTLLFQINCCSTFLQVFHSNGYMYMYTMQYYIHTEYAFWKSLIWPGQRSCKWPIFQLHVTLDLDLKYNCAKFHHSTPNLSWVIVKTDIRTDRRTDGHTRRLHKAFLWNT